MFIYILVYMIFSFLSCATLHIKKMKLFNLDFNLDPSYLASVQGGIRLFFRAIIQGPISILPSICVWFSWIYKLVISFWNWIFQGTWDFKF